MHRFLSAFLYLFCAVGSALADQTLFLADFAQSTNGWQNVAFFKKPTDYTLCRDGTNAFIKGLADKSSSAFSTKLSLNPPAKLILRWRWRILGVVTNGSERDLSRFDHAARVVVAFDTFIGPPRTLNYLWANQESAGAIREHPKSGRAQLIMVESGDAKAGRWVSEERDVTADWHRAFPDKPMPKVIGLGLMTDSDSLGGRVEGDYGPLELISK